MCRTKRVRLFAFAAVVASPLIMAAIMFPSRAHAQTVVDEQSDGTVVNDAGVTSTPVKKAKSVAKADKTAATSRPASGRRVFVFNPRTLRWAAYDADGSLVRTGRASGGKGYCPDVKRGCRTITGTYTIYSKMGAGYRSTKFPLGRGGAPMPYAMFFHKGFAIHGSPDVPNHNASHGCIRVPPSDARWLNNNFLNYGSKVVVYPY